jgi:hypothetical protein
VRRGDSIPTGGPLHYAAPEPPASPLIVGTTFVGHLIGWAIGLGMFAWLSIYVVPRYERTIADYKLDLPSATKVLLLAAANARNGGLFLLLAPVGIAHSLAAAAFLRRAGRGRRATYRLVLTLVLAAVALFVILGLFLPWVGVINSLSGGAGSKK